MECTVHILFLLLWTEENAVTDQCLNKCQRIPDPGKLPASCRYTPWQHTCSVLNNFHLLNTCYVPCAKYYMHQLTKSFPNIISATGWGLENLHNQPRHRAGKLVDPGVPKRQLDPKPILLLLFHALSPPTERMFEDRSISGYASSSRSPNGSIHPFNQRKASSPQGTVLGLVYSEGADTVHALMEGPLWHVRTCQTQSNNALLHK